nr:unnamed protein product [Naegleria fowleri]
MFSFNPTDQTSLKEYAILLPTYFNIGRSILNSNYQDAKIDYRLKMCHNGRIVDFDPNVNFAKVGDASAQQEQAMQQQVHQKREDRRAILKEAAEIRHERRQEQVKNNVKTKY